MDNTENGELGLINVLFFLLIFFFGNTFFSLCLMKFFFDSLNSTDALKAKEKFVKIYGQEEAKNADIIVPIGGDGFLGKTLIKYLML